MAQLSAERYYAQIAASTAAIAALVDGADLSLPIPTCPGWTLRHLATHVGRAHRWAAAITATRSAEFIPFRAVPDGRFPDDPAQHAAWLTAGAQRVTDAVREAGSDAVWAFGGLVPASFWGRRMCHETLVHAADAQLAAGQLPDLPADTAADAIDEWLTVTSGPGPGRPDPRAAALPEGRALLVRATGDRADEVSEWLVSHQAGGVSVQRGAGGVSGLAGPGSTAGSGASARADITLSGPAAQTLLVLVRRIGVAEASDGPAPVTVDGDEALLSQWLAQTIF